METALAWMIGPWEIVMIVAAMVLLFGAKKIPTLMRSLGSGMTEFKKGIREGERSDDAPQEPVEAPSVTKERCG